MTNLLIDMINDQARAKERRHRASTFHYNENWVYRTDYLQQAVHLHVGKALSVEMMTMIEVNGDHYTEGICCHWTAQADRYIE